MQYKKYKAIILLVGVIGLSIFLYYFIFGERFNTLSSIDLIRKDCGELCDTTRHGTAGPYFNHTKANINCEAIFKNTLIDSGHHLVTAPNKIPENLLQFYQMNGRIPISEYYFNTQYLEKSAALSHWSKEVIEEIMKKVRQGNFYGNYGVSETNALRDGLKHTPGVKNGRVLVIGSETPWPSVEACVLEADAREVVTLEYGRINCTHPSVKTMIPKEFRERFLNRTLGLFDAVVAFGSVEHTGLGRYGDALNPWGDIIAIARGWCVTKESGNLAIAAMFDNMKDGIAFNAHRIYGSIRYPYLTTNWRQLYQGQGSQRVFVFEKYTP